MRVACIYDTNTPHTTGIYFDKAFRSLGFWVDTFHHDEIKDIPNDYQIIFVCDSGPIYDIPEFKQGITIYYGIDVHLEYDSRLKMAQTAKIAAFAQYSAGAKKAQDTKNNIIWLPLACDPEIHKDYQVERDLDVAFVGHLYDDDLWRTTIKEQLEMRGYNVFVGETSKEEMAKIYSRAKVVINHTVRDNKQDVNMRCFEAMSCGAYLLTQKLDNNDMDKIFDPHLYTAYKDDDDMWIKLNEIIRNKVMYHDIAQRAKLFIRSTHTYQIHTATLINNIINDENKKNRLFN